MSNAYTTQEYTTYHFDVKAGYLDQALDIMTSFFIAPLMDPSATERELKSVHSEDKQGEKTDIWRAVHVHSELADPAHPASKFMGGNLTSLDVEPRRLGINVRERLLQFHSQYYSSNLTKAVIAGPESLDELEAMAKRHFSAIPNKNLPLPRFGTQPYVPGIHLGREVFIQTIKHMQKIELMFQLPSTLELYKDSSYFYLSHLIGHEGRGSLFYHLKSLGWANWLESSTQSGENRDFDAFVLKISLTREGALHHKDEIIAMVFDYLEMLKREGPQKWIFDELRILNQTQFDTLNKEDIASAPTEYVANMWMYPPEDILRGTYATDIWNPELVSSILTTIFTPENMILSHFSASFDDMVLDKKEKWYGVPYHVRPLSDSLRQAIAGVTSNPSPHFYLPKPNAYLPANLTIHPFPADVQALVESRKHSAAKMETDGKTLETFDFSQDPLLWREPTCIADNLLCRAWHLQDALFPTNTKMSVQMMIHLPAAYSSAHNFILTRLYCTMVKDVLNEYIYDASLAGISCSLTPSFEGMSLKVGGYAEKVPLFLNSILRGIRDLEIDKERFEVLHQDAVRMLSNELSRSKPISQAEGLLDIMTCQPRWTVDEKLYACSLLEYEDMLTAKRILLRQVKIETLIFGNVASEIAAEIANDAVNIFSAPKSAATSKSPVEMDVDAKVEETLPAQFASHPTFTSQIPLQRTVSLPLNTDVRITRSGTDPENPNSAVHVWYQVCQCRDLRSLLLLDIAGNVLFEHFYDSLRTKEQLGYTVMCGLRSQSMSSGFRFIVQSSEYTAAYLLSRIDNYINVTLMKYLDELSDEDFESQIQAQFAGLTEHPTPKGRANLFWQPIEDASYNFSRRKKEIGFLKTLTKSDLINFIKGFLARHSRVSTLVESQMKPSGSDSAVKPEEEKTVAKGKSSGKASKAASQKTGISIVDVKNIVAYKNSLSLLPCDDPEESAARPFKDPEPIVSIFAFASNDHADSDEEKDEEEEEEECEDDEEDGEGEEGEEDEETGEDDDDGEEGDAQ